MSSGSHLQMHADHAHWGGDEALWRDELEVWRRETDEAISQLRAAEQSLRAHWWALDEHARGLESEKANRSRHEHLLAEFEQGVEAGGDLELLRTAKLHRKEGEEHFVQCDMHERLKAAHRELLARYASLFRRLDG